MRPPLTETASVSGTPIVRNGARAADAIAAGQRRVGLVLALICGDAVAVAVAFALAYTIRFRTELGVFYRPPESPITFYSSLVFLLDPLILLVFAGYRLYRTSQLFDGADEYMRIVSASTVATMLVVLGSFLLDSALIISRGWLVISWLALIACMVASRFIARRVVHALRVAGKLVTPIILVGEGL